MDDGDRQPGGQGSRLTAWITTRFRDRGFRRRGFRPAGRISGHGTAIARRLTALASIAMLSTLAAARAQQAAAARTDPDGTVHVPAFRLPESSLLDPRTRDALSNLRELTTQRRAQPGSCPSEETANRAKIVEVRACLRARLFRSRLFEQWRTRYPVDIRLERIGGVQTEVVTPREGVSAENRNRVLINLHGGHFTFGSGTISLLESIPIASVGRIRVISIDYRMAPEHRFPAASEDVAAVYRQLIRTYRPRNIGIYGCSAGGLLTAQSVAWFQNEGLPLPGAVAMFGAGASYYQEGDSTRLAFAMEGRAVEPPGTHPYFAGTDPSNPLAFPIRSREMMARFPPSLLVTSSRDLALSSVVHTHRMLRNLGVDAELRVWEGLGHCFYFGQDVPEAAEVYDAASRFFDAHLGR